MEAPVQRTSNLYNVKVKDKVKQLEASLNQQNGPNNFLSPRGFSRTRGYGGRKTSSGSNLSSVTASAESIPAVMDVEQTQMTQAPVEPPVATGQGQEAPLAKPSRSPRPSLVLKIPPRESAPATAAPSVTTTATAPTTTTNGLSKNSSVDNGSRPGTPSTPTDVKSLLKKFTNGVSNTLRRMSSGTIDVSHLRGIQDAQLHGDGSTSPSSSVSSQNDGPSAILKEFNEKKGTNGNCDEPIGRNDSPTSAEPEPEVMTFRKRLSISFRGLRSRHNSVNEEEEENEAATDKTDRSLKRLPRPTNGVSNSNNNKALTSESNNNKGVDSEGFQSVKVLKKTFERNGSITEEGSKVSHSNFKSKPVVCNAAPTLRNDEDSLEQLRRDTSNESNEEPGPTASLFVIGQKGSGKSSIINHLLNSDLLTTHGPKKTSSKPEVTEISVKVESFMNPATLKVLDVPGFTNNDDYNASIISTLLAYKKKAEGIQGKVPVATLVVLKCESDEEDDVEVEESVIRLLKILNHFQHQFVSPSETIFVFTHIPEGAMEEVDNISSELSHVIREQMRIGNGCDINIAFYEPQQEDPNNNNPTEESTPHQTNLLGRLRKIIQSHTLKDNSDEWTAMTSTFGQNHPQGIIQCYASKRIPLMPWSHPDTLAVQKSIRTQLASKAIPIERTEITSLLEIGWENVDQKLRQLYPSSLQTLLQLFQKLKIRDFADLPDSGSKILSILKQIPQHNPVVADLLTETLQLRVPSCFPALYIGQGFDVSKDRVTQVSPFQFSGGLKTSPVGLIPEEIGCKLTDDREIVFKFYLSNEDYILDRFRDLSIKNASLPPNHPPVMIANQRIGYNIIKPNQEPSKSTTSTALIEYRVFQLSLGRSEELEFKPQFWELVTTLPDLDTRQQDTVDAWQEFFQYWGTHVVKSAYGGGFVQVNFRGQILSRIYKSLKQDAVLPSDEFETSKVFQWITGDGLNLAATPSSPKSKSGFLKGYDVDMLFHGGDMKFKPADLTKIPLEEVDSLREEWFQSLPLNPIMLESNLALVPLSYFVREKSNGLATKMDIAFHHFYANFMAFQGKQSSCAIL